VWKRRSDSAGMGDSEKSGPNARQAGSSDAATKEAAAAAIKETRWSRAGAAGRVGGGTTVWMSELDDEGTGGGEKRCISSSRVGQRDQLPGGSCAGGWAGFGCGGPRPWSVQSMLAALPKPLLRPRQSAVRV